MLEQWEQQQGGWDDVFFCPWAFVLFMVSCLSLGKNVRTVPHRIIFRACCALEQNTSSTFVRMRAHGVYVSVILYLFEVHIFSAFKIHCCRIFVKEICNPKFIYFPKESVRLPHECEMEQNIDWWFFNSMSYIEKSTLQIFLCCSFTH